MSYPYSQGDRLEERNTYFYSEYHGVSFLAAWKASRDAALHELPSAKPLQPTAAGHAFDGTCYDTAALLGPQEPFPALDRLLQRFEVSKRIYRKYDAAFKAVRDTGYDDLTLYIQFAGLCLRCQSLRFLNALLKTVDSVISVRERLTPLQAAQLAWLILEERAWVQRIAAGVGVEP